MTTFNASLEIPATIEQVFAALSHPERLARRGGSAGFTNTFNVCEFKSAGRWWRGRRKPLPERRRLMIRDAV